MNAEGHHLSITRVVDAPRRLVYRAFTNPDDLAAWWGPAGNELPRDEIDFDVRPGGHQRWTEVNPASPDLRVQVHLDLADVAENELIEGVMRVSGRFGRNRMAMRLTTATGTAMRNECAMAWA